MTSIVYYCQQASKSHRETDHPERPERVTAIADKLDVTGLLSCMYHIQNIQTATLDQLHKFHTLRHIDSVLNLQRINGHRSDIPHEYHHPSDDDDDDADDSEADKENELLALFSGYGPRRKLRHVKRAKKCYHRHEENLPCMVEARQVSWNSVYATNATPQAARAACGNVISLIQAVLRDNDQNASGMAVIRPPGHHASHDDAAGFCIFNNVAVAIANLPVGTRVCVLDMDIHAGNDGEHPNPFYDRDDVLMIDIHRYNNGRFYPCGIVGDPSYIGKGKGAGHNINIGWNHEVPTDADYKHAFERVVLPVMKEYKPDIVIVSAGCDCVAGDELGGANVTPQGYAHLLQMVRDNIQARMAVVLEGGYNTESISNTFTCIANQLVVSEDDNTNNEQLQIIRKMSHELNNQPDDVAVQAVNDTIHNIAAYWQCYSSVK